MLLNRPQVQEYKRQTIEAINPAAKERRLVGELKNNLANLELTLAKNPKNAAGSEEISSLLNSAKSTLQELQETSQKNDIGANLSNLIQKVVPLAATPSPTWLPPPARCIK